MMAACVEYLVTTEADETKQQCNENDTLESRTDVASTQNR